MLNVLRSDTLADPLKEICFQYKNWRGEVSLRKVLPLKMWFGSTDWHAGDQWFIKAIDLEKGEERDFALLDITFPKDQT